MPQILGRIQESFSRDSQAKIPALETFNFTHVLGGAWPGLTELSMEVLDHSLMISLLYLPNVLFPVFPAKTNPDDKCQGGL